MIDNYMCGLCKDTLIYYEDVEENGVLVRKLKNCDCREKRKFRAYCNAVGVMPEKNEELAALLEKQMPGIDTKRSIFLNGLGIKKPHIMYLFMILLLAEEWPEFHSYVVQNFIDAWFDKGRPIEGDPLLITGYHEIHLDYWENAVIATLDRKLQEGTRLWVYLDNNRFPKLRNFCFQNLQVVDLPGTFVPTVEREDSRKAVSAPQREVVQSGTASNAADRAMDDVELRPTRCF